ncbi:hypothetical protein [Sandaracinus amylolyticus]|uniref:hypothetical protein n=1 Tax=Sandaracinus amylolyticus TaxID=927083 RepID=UPI001F30B6C4|nr:hypothetical protein [Sandaracinus amylolyticus]UJR80380.1 Hypothetical protein I5071_24260 [Sandaracinus amylolyticus]
MRDAIARRAQWNVLAPDEAQREIVVRAIGCREVSVRGAPGCEIVDLEVLDEGPMLWAHGARVTLSIEDPMSREVHGEILARVAGAAGHWSYETGALSVLEPGRAPFVWRDLPRAIADIVLEIGAQHGIEVRVLDEHRPRGCRALVLDQSDFVIAERFEVDVPDFVHLDAWAR